MANVIFDKNITTYEEAIDLVYSETHLPEVSPDFLRCFKFIPNTYDKGELKSMAIKSIDKELKKVLKECKWEAFSYYIAIPRTKYLSNALPYLNFTIELYVVASVAVSYEVYYKKMDRYCNENGPCVSVIIRLVEEVTNFNVPLLLIKALSEHNDSQYEIIMKEPNWTTWDVNGFEARIPDTFISMIKRFNGNSIGESLEALKIIDTGVGQLIDKGLSKQVSSFNQGTNLPVSCNKVEELITCLKNQMGYPDTEAEKAANYIKDKFPQAGLEEQIKEAVIYLNAK